jgi:AcrR family transcriptional regulator
VTQAAPSRRDRMRAATMDEITTTARRLLVEQGPDATSLRAIAREMGMTAPGLYRYYNSREELFRHVVATIFHELSRDIQHAIDEAGWNGEAGLADKAGVAGSAGPVDETGAADEAGRRLRVGRQVAAACREFRRWGLGHKDEFILLFGIPLPWLGEEKFDIAEKGAMEFIGTFYGLFSDLWRTVAFPVPRPEEIDEALRVQLGSLRATLRTEMPDGALVVFLRCWMVLYGAVSMEVFGHLRFAIDDPAPMFEYTLGDLARLVGLEYPFR